MIYFVILLWSCLLSGVLSMGIRGAAERALYFSGYVMEEAYLDASSREIATGCVGTRVGLRGQANRCTLKEFCEHLWSPTLEANDEPADRRPDPRATWWSKEVRLSATRGLKAPHDTVNMRDWIMQVRLKVPADMNNDINPKTENLPKYGYYGPVAIGNLIHGANQDNYFQTVGDMGERIANAWKHYEAHMDEITDKEIQESFKNWYKTAELAADDAIMLRGEDEARMRKKIVAQKLRKDFPDNDPRKKLIQITTKTVSSGEKSKISYEDLDIDATARNLAGPLQLTEDEIKTRIYDILRHEEGSQQYHSHQAAKNAL